MIKLNSCRPPLSQFPVIKSTDNSRQKENHVHVNISTLEEKHRWTIGVWITEWICLSSTGRRWDFLAWFTYGFLCRWTDLSHQFIQVNGVSTQHLSQIIRKLRERGKRDPDPMYFLYQQVWHDISSLSMFYQRKTSEHGHI